MLTIETRNFGPIKSGRVELKPLTVFIGRNNVGKSYFGMLAYALAHTFHIRQPDQIFNDILSRIFAGSSYRSWVQQQYGKGIEEFSLNQLPDDLQRISQEVITERINVIIRELERELKRIFASDITNLIRYNSREECSITIEQVCPERKFNLKIKKEHIEIEPSYKFDFLERPIKFEKNPSPTSDLPGLTYDLSKSHRAYYLPAARSGILHSHKILASVIVRQSPLFNLDPSERPELSGVIADFIVDLFSLDLPSVHADPEISLIGEFLEKKVSGGKVDIRSSETKFGSPDIFYEIKKKKLSLHRTSSMVSEIAPVVLFLKKMVRKDELLIIEEPEAHLHPDNQRIFAQAIVRLIRAGVRVLVTTHSDYFLQQLSNFIKLSAKPDLRNKLGYTDQDFLKTQEVSAYLFRGDGNGSIVEPLEITETDGIPEDAFVQIAEEIYEETAQLDFPAESPA